MTTGILVSINSNVANDAETLTAGFTLETFATFNSVAAIASLILYNF